MDSRSDRIASGAELLSRLSQALSTSSTRCSLRPSANRLLGEQHSFMNRAFLGIAVFIVGLGCIILAGFKIGTYDFQYASEMISLLSWHSNVLPPQATNFSYLFWNFYIVVAVIFGIVLMPAGLITLFRANPKSQVREIVQTS